MADGGDAQWFLKDEHQQFGPLTEREMRRHLKSSTSDSLQVKQGDSDWHPADLIRKKIRDLKKFGIYVKFGSTAEGPFTLTRAFELLQTIGSDGIEVRTGARAGWVPAVEWLATIRELRQKDQQDMESIAAAVRKAANGKRVTKRR